LWHFEREHSGPSDHGQTLSGCRYKKVNSHITYIPWSRPDPLFSSQLEGCPGILQKIVTIMIFLWGKQMVMPSTMAIISSIRKDGDVSSLSDMALISASHFSRLMGSNGTYTTVGGSSLSPFPLRRPRSLTPDERDRITPYL
jgi:hypothetical protein